MPQECNDLEKSAPRIAVIGVHGVADQQPFETAGIVSNLLLTLPGESDSNSRYAAFTESTLRVPQRPVVIHGKAEDGRSRWSLHSQYAQRCFDKENTQPDPHPDYGFMKSLMRDAEPDRAGPAYETIRLTSMRKDPEDGSCASVDVFEMYWADLSRPGAGFVRMLSEFYQLLFHVCSLGRHTVDLARAQHPRRAAWWLLSKSQALSARLMSLLIPVFSLFLLLVGLTILPSYIPESWQRPAVAAVLGIAVSFVVGRLLYRRSGLSFFEWALPPLLTGVGAALLIALYQGPVYRLLAIEWVALLAFTVVALTFRAYARHRPGAVGWAWFIGVPSLAVWLFYLASNAADQRGVIRAALSTAEWIDLGLNIVWVAFLATNLVVWVSGSWIMRTETHRREEAKRAIWTGRLALALPTALYLIVTLALWAVLAMLAKQSGSFAFLYDPVFPRLIGLEQSARVPAADFLDQVLKVEATAASFQIIVILLAVALILAAWGLLPAVWAEVRPPKSPDENGQRSIWLGNWLDHGFYLLRYLGLVVFLVVMALPLAALLANPLFPYNFGWHLSDDTWLLTTVAGVLAGSAAGLVAFGRRLNKLAGGFRSLLDVMLDVDNWLREYPRAGNPRSRICMRYVSLLRHVCNWRDSRGRGYDAVVIAGHSQGTVITADLLRFLRHEADPDLVRLGTDIKVYLFTLGCPLRQLYSARFPHLYGWARRPRIDEGEERDPSKLSVELWVNAFRSGDYVGRYLWRADDYEYQWLPPVRDEESGTWLYVSEDERGRWRELCIGVGAHTHYFDATASLIATELDGLIDKAARRSRLPAEQCYPITSQKGGTDVDRRFQHA